MVPDFVVCKSGQRRFVPFACMYGWDVWYFFWMISASVHVHLSSLFLFAQAVNFSKNTKIGIIQLKGLFLTGSRYAEGIEAELLEDC